VDTLTNAHIEIEQYREILKKLDFIWMQDPGIYVKLDSCDLFQIQIYPDGIRGILSDYKDNKTIKFINPDDLAGYYGLKIYN